MKTIIAALTSLICLPTALAADIPDEYSPFFTAWGGIHESVAVRFTRDENQITIELCIEQGGEWKSQTATAAIEDRHKRPLIVSKLGAFELENEELMSTGNVFFEDIGDLWFNLCADA